MLLSLIKLKVSRITEEVNPISRKKSWNKYYKAFNIEGRNEVLFNDKILGYNDYFEIIDNYFNNLIISKASA